jgi:hypothetical protein
MAATCCYKLETCPTAYMKVLLEKCQGNGLRGVRQSALILAREDSLVQFSALEAEFGKGSGGSEREAHT